MRTSNATLILAAAMTLSAETYRDPQQRYQLDVPAGWAAQPFGQGVSLSKGNTYMLIMDAAGAGASPAALDRWSGQFTSQWTNTQEIKSGSATLGGQPAAYRLLSGVNPKGAPALLKIMVAPSLVLIASSPEGEFAAAKAAFERIERSFVLRGSDRMAQGPSGGYGSESGAGGNGQNPGGGNYGPGASGGGYGQGGQGGYGPGGQGGYGPGGQGGYGPGGQGGYAQGGPGGYAQGGQGGYGQGGQGGYAQGGQGGYGPGGQGGYAQGGQGGYAQGGPGGYGPGPQGGYPQGGDNGAYGPGPGGPPPAGSAFAGLAVRDAGPGQQGAVVGMVAPNSPAARAGIQPGDLILAVNRNPVRSGADIPAAILACHPGDILELVIARNQRPVVFKLKLEARQ